MAEGNNNPRSRSSHASKPYDVSNSFVRRITSKVTEYLPQPTSWLSRWMSPSAVPDAGSFANHAIGTSSRLPATSRSQLNLDDSVDHPVPAKKARTSRFHSPVTQNNIFRSDGYGPEDISPIAVRGEPSSSAGRREPAAVAGPSSAPAEFIASTPALSAPQQNSTKVNGDDCSETSESTSGCSSLVPQAQSTHRSLGGSRYLPPGGTMDSLYRKRPSFSTSTFISPLRGSVRERLGRSPFYAGRTMYGGSAGVARLLAPAQTRHHAAPVLVTPMASPAQQQATPLSATAKRILDALEQFSTPCADAKRMPVVVGSKRRHETTPQQRYTELSIPGTAELLRVKRRERLQQSTNAVRQATRLPPPPATSPAPTPEYSLRQEEPETKKHAGVGKVKTKEVVAEERLVEVKLPTVTLKLDKPPKIDIAIPPPPPATVPAPTSSFTFSSPRVEVSSRSAPLIPAAPTPMFTFSAPIPESHNSSGSLRVDKLSRTPSDTEKLKSVDDSASVTSSDSSSVTDTSTSFASSPLTKPIFTPPVNAVVNSKPEKVVKHDTTPTTTRKTETSVSNVKSQKPLDITKNNVKSNAVNFGELVAKQSTGTWECSTCLIRNKSSAQTCSACFSAKPEPKLKSEGDATKMTSTVTTTSFSGFGDKFKNPVGSWECDSCMVRNKAETSVCVSCQTPKSGTKPSSDSKPQADLKAKTQDKPIGFGNMFKKPAGSWACDTCMVTNNADVVKCIACDTVKPGATVPKSTTESKAPTFSFGIPSTVSTNTSTVSSSFSFGIAKTDQSESTKPTTASSSLTTGFSISTSQSPASTPAFSFGIPKPAKTENDSSSSAVSSSKPTTPMFQFGNAANATPPTAETEPAESKPRIKRKATPLRNNVNTSEESNKEASPIVISKLESLASPASKSPKTKITFNEPGKPNTEKLNSIPMFSFGSSNKTSQPQPTSNSLGDSKPPQTTFVFGATQPSSNAQPTNNSISGGSNLFKFGESKTEAPSGDKPTPSQQFSATKPNNIFNFGSSNATERKEISFTTQVTKESIVPSNTSSTTSENKPMFGSFGAAQTPQVTFGNSSTFGSSTFGNTQQEPNAFAQSQTTTNLFGMTQTTTASTSFGQTNAFSAQTVQENKSSAVFTFGAAPKEAANSGGFVFNPVPEKRTEPAFNFTAQPTNTSVSGFGGFTNPSSTPAFNFEPKPYNASAATPFNAPAATPVFGAATPQQQTSGFAQQQPAPAPVFAFGAQPTQPAANPVFEFQPSQQAPVAPSPAPTTAFVFGANPTTAAAPAAPPAFDPNVKPTFNFTQGAAPTAFSAIPVVNSTGPTQAPAARKIRTAVRRKPTVRH